MGFFRAAILAPVRCALGWPIPRGSTPPRKKQEIRLTRTKKARNSANCSEHAGAPALRKESADKPGSVVSSHSSGIRVTAQLKRPTRKPMRGPRISAASGVLFPYLVLLQVGFAVPLMLPPARCALTAPFHPYRRRLRGT